MVFWIGFGGFCDFTGGARRRREVAARQDRRAALANDFLEGALTKVGLLSAKR